jgi:hypothetical protein
MKRESYFDRMVRDPDYYVRIQKIKLRMTVVLLALAALGFLAGCYSDGQLAQMAARDAAATQAAQPKPERPRSTASPYFFVSPWLGTWVLQGDATFEIVMDAAGRVRYGPLFAGAYRLVQQGTPSVPNATIMQYDLVATEGQLKGQRLPSMLFQVEFADNGTIMILTNGGSRVVMLKKNEAMK